MTDLTTTQTDPDDPDQTAAVWQGVALLAITLLAYLPVSSAGFIWNDDDLTAILALIGYSLNDSIVVADRIRENFRNTRETDPEKIVNDAINEMLNRTINTSLTTALVLLALFFFGGEVMRSFSEALLVGIVVGTYSSIYVVANLIFTLNVTKEDFLVVEKEEIDEMP